MILHSAAAAAAAIRRARQEEEETMTPYRPDDLTDDWEFKILRSSTGAFKNQQVLKQALEEEARAGWVLVEKFDNGRVRLKRPVSAKKNDGALDFDPYRTTYGISESRLVLLIIAMIVGLLVGTALTAALFAR
jgi:hypothetical protein